MGGGGGGQYYANLEKLYGTQAAQAERLQGLSEKLTYPMYDRMVNESLDYGSQANKERAAAQAKADAEASFGNAMGSYKSDLASMGVNPEDPRYGREMRKLATTAYGGGAASMTGARERADQMGFARMQDTTGLLAGVPSSASSAMSSAASTGSNLAGLYQQNQQQNAANVGGAVRGGIDLYGFAKQNPGMWADGGPVLKLKGGGYVQRLAKGGIVGAMENLTPPPPPSTGAPAPSNAGVVGQGLMRGREMAGTGIEKVGDMAGSADVSAFGQGLRLGKEAQPAIDAYSQAAQQVNSILPAAGETTAAAAAGGEGALLEGVAGSMGSGAALGAAMPWLGAAMLAGSALGMFKDGGKVTPGSTSRSGGEVDGPGGPKDDRVPALLSDGEFVMPIGAVKKFGLDRLEKMRQAGLEFEKQLGITKA